MVARFHYDEQVYRQLLKNELPSDESSEVTGHIEACEDCQSRLMAISEEGIDWEDVRDHLRPDPPSSSASQAATQGISDATAVIHDDSNTGFLQPTDRESSLGRFGRYEIESVLGRGGMGVVLQGYDPALNRHSAIKVLAPELATSAAARTRFAREAKSAAAVVHEHVVPIQTVDEERGLPYLVMPVVEGKSLEQRVEQTGPLQLNEILRIGMQAAAGLAAAHGQGLVHRDIKPANILLENGVERVMITDFGLARAADDANMTQSGVIAGTPQYMSPEQARGADIDCRSDLFSLGSVLYYMCTGHSPFRAETTMGVLNRITHDSPREVRKINSDIPVWLQDIIERLLSKSPDDRIQTAEEVAELLGQWLAHVQQPDVISKPARVAKHRTKAASASAWTGSRKAVIAVGSLLMLLMAAVVIVLEFNKGTLTIDAASPGVPIQILKDGRTYKTMTVTPTNNSVRIAAGEYVVEILGEHEGLHIEGGSVTVTRGGKEVVKIVQSASASDAATESMVSETETDADSDATGSRFPVGIQLVLPDGFEILERQNEDAPKMTVNSRGKAFMVVRTDDKAPVCSLRVLGVPAERSIAAELQRKAARLPVEAEDIYLRRTVQYLQSSGRTLERLLLDDASRLTPEESSRHLATIQIVDVAESALSKAGTTERIEHARLHGVWHVVTAQDGGRPMDASDTRIVFTTANGVGHVQFWDDDEAEDVGTYVLGHNEDFRTIDMSSPGKPGMLGIYDFLDGDTMRLCCSEKPELGHPIRFASERDGQNDLLLELKRISREVSAAAVLEAIKASMSEVAREIKIDELVGTWEPTSGSKVELADRIIIDRVDGIKSTDTAAALQMTFTDVGGDIQQGQLAVFTRAKSTNFALSVTDKDGVFREWHGRFSKNVDDTLCIEYRAVNVRSTRGKHPMLDWNRIGLDPASPRNMKSAFRRVEVDGEMPSNEASPEKGPVRQGDASKTIDVRLRIVDDESGEPLKQFRVGHGTAAPEQETTWMDDLAGKHGVQKRPLEDGIQISLVPHIDPVDYWLRVTSSGYVPQIVKDGPLIRLAGKVVEVRMRRGTSVEARVLSSLGEPVKRATIYLIRDGEAAHPVTEGPHDGDRTYYTIPFTTKTITGSDGTFRLTGVDSRSDRLGIVPPNETLVVLPLPAARPEQMEFRLPESSTLSIAVEPVEEFDNEFIHIRFMSETAEGGKNVFAGFWRMIGEDGTCRVEGLPAGRYEVSRMKRIRLGNVGRELRLDLQRIDLTVGDDQTIVFKQANGPKLRGSVEGLQERSLTSAMITFQLLDEETDRKRLLYIEADEAVSCQDDGTFETGPLRPGRYKWSLQAYGESPLEGLVTLLPLTAQFVAEGEIVINAEGDPSPLTISIPESTPAETQR